MTLMPLLALCASIDGDPERYERIREVSDRLDSWTGLLVEAERHGMAPLVRRHLRAAQVAVPPEAATALNGVYVRHRHANSVRAAILSRIIEAFQATAIPVLVVKGGALAHMLYPDPALRPMSDLDLLVDPEALAKAAGTLQELGLSAALVHDSQGGKGLTTAGMFFDDVWVGVELHTDLFEAGFPASLTMNSLTVEPRAFQITSDGPIAFTLGLEDLLWHLCLHLRFHTTVFLPWRMIWITDIIGVAEGRAGPVDWDVIRSRYPAVLRTLALIDCLCPLAQAVREDAGLARGHPPPGIGADFNGWPRHAIAEQREKGRLGVLRDTLAPSEWWLRLHYGLDARAPALVQRLLLHPFEICRRAAGMLIRDR